MPSRVVDLSEMRTLVLHSRRPCAVCHRRGALNPHSVNAKQVELMRGCEWLHRRGHDWVRLETGDKMRAGDVEMKAPYRASTLAVYLKWFGLMEDQGRRTAMWRVTERGRMFLAGKVTVPARALCRDGKIIYVSSERAGVASVVGIVHDEAYWRRYPRSAL